MSENSNDLETFRKQWRQEVLQKQTTLGEQSRSKSQTNSNKIKTAGSVTAQQSSLLFDARIQPSEDDASSKTYNLDDLDEREESRKLGVSGTGVRSESRKQKEPVSALEHYEAAVEREKEGKLGESLRLYRRAFKVLFSTFLALS